MLRIAATIGVQTYYFATEDLDFDGKFWEARISNPFEIARNFDVSESTGNRIRSIQVSLDNRDNFFRAIETSTSLLNTKFVLYFGDGSDKVKTFTGRVNKVDSFGDDVTLTLMEQGYEYLKQNYPDAQIAYDFYSESGINNNWNAIPIPIGFVNRIPLSWVNLFRSEFIIGSGPLFRVNRLYFDKVVVYDQSTGKNGYKPSPESEEIKFRIFHGVGSIGSPEVVGGVTSEYPGFAYVQLYKMVDGTEEPADPVTADGSVTQIYADVEGIVNDAGTGAERNPIKILYKLFNKPTTGYEGYGLGLDSSELDFADAIIEAEIQGFKIDGAIDSIAEFEQWCNEILRCSRAILTEENGKIKVYVDKSKSYSGVHLDETGESGYDAIVGSWNEPELDAQINRLKLSYSWNFETNDFNKKPGVHEESPILDPNLKDETHALRVGKWNTDTLEFKLVKDDTTAHKLAQYYLKRNVKQLKTTTIQTEVDIPDIDAGALIKVTSPKHGWIAKEFVVTQITRAEEFTTVNVREYSSDVYTFIDPGTAGEETGNPYSAYNLPAKPVLTNIEVVNEILTDGSNQTRLNVSFTRSTTNIQMVALYCKEESEAESAFRVVDFTINENSMTTIWKGRASGNYNFRLVSISPVGIYSEIDIDVGDKHYYGQPDAEESLALVGDEVAPGTPIISDVNPVIGGASIYITIGGGLPEDFSHFKIYRKIGVDDPVLIDAKHTSQLFTDVDRTTAYDSRVYYAIAVDTSGNESDLSLASASVTPLKVNTDDIYAGSVTTDLLTAEQILAKDFRTACNAGNGTVSGVIFNSSGIQAWNGATRTFNLSSTGSLELSGTITALAGAIGGWSIAENCIYGNNIGLFSSGSIQTLDFVSGNKGWKIDCLGNAEFNNAYVRGAIKSAVFQYDQISAIGGNLLVRPAQKLENPSELGYSIYCMSWPEMAFVVKDRTGFNVNDIIRIKDGVNDQWRRISYIEAIDSGYMLDTAEICYGNCGWCAYEGQGIVNYGQSGAGGIFLDGQSGYMDIYTHDGCPWNGTCSRVRLGNLCGWGAFGTNYGIAIGNHTDMHKLTYDTSSGKLKIYGDVEVLSNGNILPEPDFGAIPYSSLLTSPVIGIYGEYEYYATGAGCSCVYGAHRDAYPFLANLKECSNGVVLVASCMSCARIVSNNFIPVKCNATYTLSTYISKISGSSEPNIYIGLYYYDINMTVICYDYPLLNACNWSCTTLSRISATKTMPSNAAYVKLYILNYRPPYINHSCVLISGMQLELGSTATAWKCNQGGTITAQKVISGVLKSLNFSTTLGSCFNLNDGTFVMGGSSAPALSWNGTTLSVSGTVCSCAGNIGGWTIGNGCIVATGVYMYTAYGFYTCGYGDYAMHGKMYDCNTWVCAYGYSATKTTARAHFMAGVIGSAGYTPPSGTAMAAGCPFFYVGTGSSAYLQYYNGIVTVKGVICATSGTFCGAIYAAAGQIANFNIGSLSIATCAIGAGSSCDGMCLYSVANLSTGAGIYIYCSNGTCQSHVCLRAQHGTTLSAAPIYITLASVYCYAMYTNAMIYTTGGIIVCGTYSNVCICSCNFGLKIQMSGCYGLCSCVGTCYAIYGNSLCNSVYGYARTSYGVVGSAVCQFGVYGSACCYGVYGYASRSNGVHGYAPLFNGVYGCANCYGVYGVAATAYGVYGSAPSYPVAGNGAYYNTSTRTLKQNFEDVCVLEGLRNICIQKWSWADINQRTFDEFIAPTAEDVANAWGLTFNDDGYYTLDGIALKAAQEVDENVQKLEHCIFDLETRLRLLEEKIGVN